MKNYRHFTLLIIEIKNLCTPKEFEAFLHGWITINPIFLLVNFLVHGTNIQIAYYWNRIAERAAMVFDLVRIRYRIYKFPKRKTPTRFNVPIITILLFPLRAEEIIQESVAVSIRLTSIGQPIFQPPINLLSTERTHRRKMNFFFFRWFIAER